MDIRVGDRVVGTDNSWEHRVGELGTVTFCKGDNIWVLWDGEEMEHFFFKNEILRLKEKPMQKENTPKLWRDMTPEEKGALLLAKHEGKVIEWTYEGWFEWYNALLVENALWIDGCAYRIQPERETVTAKLCINDRGASLHMRPDYWRGEYGDDNFYFTLTFDIIDGKPDPASIKIEEV